MPFSRLVAMILLCEVWEDGTGRARLGWMFLAGRGRWTVDQTLGKGRLEHALEGT